MRDRDRGDQPARPGSPLGIVPEPAAIAALKAEAPGLRSPRLLMSSVPALQRAVGNAAVTRYLSPPGRALSRQPSTAPTARTAPTVESPVVEPTAPLTHAQPAADHRGRVAQRVDDGTDDGLLSGIRRRIGQMTGAVQEGWSTVGALADGAVGAVRDVGAGATERIKSAVTSVTTAAQSGWVAISGSVAAVRGAGQQMIASALGGVTGAFARVRAAVRSLDADTVQTAWTGVNNAFAGAVAGALAAGRSVTGRLGALWAGVRNGFDAGLRGAVNLASSVTDGIATFASGAMARVSSTWNGIRQHAGSLGDLAGGVGGLILRLIRPMLNRARSLWSSVQGRWVQLRQRAGRVIDGVRTAARASWTRASVAASGVIGRLGQTWNRVREGVVGAIGRIGQGVRSSWQRVRGLSISSLVSKLRRSSQVVGQLEGALADPDIVLTPFADPIAAQLAAGMPGAAESATQQRMRRGSQSPAAATRVQRQEMTAPPVVERSLSSGAEVWAGLKAAFSEKWRQIDVKDTIIETLKSIVWPWPRIGTEINGIGNDVSKAVGNLFSPRNLFVDPLGCLHDLWSDLMKILDIPLIIWRRLNNIGLLLLGPITIALTIIGAVGGAFAGTVLGAIAGALAGLGVGAAPGAAGGLAVGGIGGAGAGFGVALGVGQVILVSFVAGEATALVKVLADLFTTRQTRTEKAEDYSTAADSGLALGITAVLVGLGWIGGRVASACAAALRRFIPASVLSVIDKFTSGARRARSGEATPEKEATPPVSDGTPLVPNMQTPGPQTLTPSELGQLQAIADRYGTRIQVAGSRGQGMGRNVSSSELPTGKGPGTRSDIDVVIDGQVDINSRGGLSNDIRNSCGGDTQIASAGGDAYGPHIDITPNPTNAPSGGGAASERPTIPPPTRR